MCTLLISKDPSARWPLCIAATRDDFTTRAWQRPGFHWPSQRTVLGGQDLREGGTWLCVDTASRTLAAVLNRTEPSTCAEPRTRGELPLAVVAGKALTIDEARNYRPFNLVRANVDDCVVWRWDGHQLTTTTVPDGVHMLSATELDDVAGHPRIARWLEHLRAARRPNAASVHAGPNWRAWKTELANAGGVHDDRTALVISGVSALPHYRTLSVAVAALGETAWSFEHTDAASNFRDWLPARDQEPHAYQ